MLKKFLYSSVSVFCLAKGYETYHETYVFTRIFRTLSTGLKILYYYKIAFDEKNYLDIHEYIA